MKTTKRKSKTATAKKNKATTSTGAGDSNRRLHLRFATPEIRAEVAAQAKRAGFTTAAYGVAAILDWVKRGTLPKPQIVDKQKEDKKKEDAA